MKTFLIFLFLISSSAFAGTCTTTTRNNYSTNQVLTSSALNSDFNQLVTKVNAFDGGCVSNGSLEYDALNTTQFSPMLKGVKEGCKVSYSNASTLSVGKCLASVNGNFVYTTSPTTVSFGCSSCSAETSSTAYYVYAATGSSATTLNLLILTTAPNEDGYDNSGNRVLAKFYNNASSDIDQNLIRQWVSNQFLPAEVVFTAKSTSGGTVSDESADFINGNCAVSDTSLYTCTFVSNFFSQTPTCTMSASSGTLSALAYIESVSASAVGVRTSLPAGKSAQAFHLSCRRAGTDFSNAR
ncbi:MAG: hypothetical protein AB7I27_00365 [Bacteriovoracaceae bacterium]